MLRVAFVSSLRTLAEPMTNDGRRLIEPLRITFELECGPEHAFRTWTERPSAWWPQEHTASHEEGVAIIFEPGLGGRIFERTPTGTEISWGWVTAWEPPRRLAYSWHIATDPTDATDVEIAFTPLGEKRTRVEIEHGGWERLAERGQAWRDANHAGWDGVLPRYVEACSATGLLIDREDGTQPPLLDAHPMHRPSRRSTVQAGQDPLG